AVAETANPAVQTEVSQVTAEAVAETANPAPQVERSFVKLVKDAVERHNADPRRENEPSRAILEDPNILVSRDDVSKSCSGTMLRLDNPDGGEQHYAVHLGQRKYLLVSESDIEKGHFKPNGQQLAQIGRGQDPLARGIVSLDLAR
ncbi:MAG TPA: hypothetical protein VE591_00805, partial [Candidatus Acidoferrum sp.]|nr:hypothetical protein [Candidatus Acidoferrum sp.]